MRRKPESLTLNKSPNEISAAIAADEIELDLIDSPEAAQKLVLGRRKFLDFAMEALKIGDEMSS